MIKGCVASIGVVGLVVMIAGDVLTTYQYDKEVGSYWALSVKAATLDKKAEFLDHFIVAIDSAHLSGYNAIFLKTPDNSVEQNMAALRSLQSRMREIRNMDVTSFAYQQAISQITAQEQDEATRLLSVIEGRWFLTHWPLWWNWIETLFVLASICLVAVPTIVYMMSDEF